MALGIVESDFKPSQFDDGAAGGDSDDCAHYPKCTLCSYCPKRCRTDGFDRIEAHVRRCHGADLVAEVVEESKKRFELIQRQQKASKTYKTPPIQCPKCGQIIHGTQSNLQDHINSRKCKKNRREEEEEEEVDSPDASSSSSANLRSGRKRGRLANESN